jgi:oxygen-dependent protoporphyrinogen oxidase
MKVVVVGGGIAGLAAARRLEALAPDAEIVLVERTERLGGKILTERFDGFVVEGAPDSYLSRKERGIGLCEELGLAGELVGRRPENDRSYVRRGDELYPLPAGLTGMIPTDVDALAGSPLLSESGRARLAAEVDLPPTPPNGDESIASFVSRRLGREAYEALVEPLMTGIYGGDGEQLSLEATFPNLRALELGYGSLLRGLAAQRRAEAAAHPPFVSLRSGMETLVRRLSEDLERTRVLVRSVADGVQARASGYGVKLRAGGTIDTDAVVLATPAFATAKLVSELDPELSAAHAEIPYASSVVVSLGYDRAVVEHPLEGYGYVVPRSEGSDVLACTWSSSKWQERAPDDRVLVRVYAGRHGSHDVSRMPKEDLVALARDEIRLIGIEAQPVLVRVHRWRYGMPQYVLGHPERLERIDTVLTQHPGLALAGAAYRGVGIPDCIRSGEEAAETVVRMLAGVAG